MKSETLSPKFIEVQNSLASAAENSGQLLPQQLEAIYEEKWFKMFVPEKYGGLGLSLPDALRLEEAFSQTDGSLGWTITLCAGANLFAGYINPDFAEDIFYDRKVCLGGSGAISGIAQVAGDGYIINGRWKYATGAPHLTHFTANCIIEQNGIPVHDEQGKPMVRSFIFKKEEVTVHHDWNMMGLKATASHSFSVQDLKVGNERIFLIDDKKALIDDLIYHYPFLQLAETTIAVNSLGMACHFFNEVSNVVTRLYDDKKMSGEKYSRMNKRLSFASNFLYKDREQFYAKADESWQQLEKTGSIDEAMLQQISLLSRSLTSNARQLVTEIYPYCGIGATQNGTTLNRIFRDIFTGSQHSLLNT